MAKMTEKEALKFWDDYRKNIHRSTDIPFNEPEGDKQKRIVKLLNNFEAFCQYYFPSYCSAPFAKFQLKFAKKVIENDTIYSVQAWSREHAKSVIGGLFLPLFLKFNKKCRNTLYVSNNEDSAIRLITPIMAQLDSNQRIINDFGIQKSSWHWQAGDFITKDGWSYLAVGAGQSPRGSRNEEVRPNLILFDDIDTDEECRNQERIDNKWRWIEQAVIPTVSIDKDKRIIFLGNIISPESTIVKASRMADDFQIINILDKTGKPSWAKNTMENINYMLSKMSYASAQKEYFNNPIVEGTVFKELKWAKVPPLSKFKFLVAYGDGSYSNRETKTNSFKSLILIGELEGIYYVITCFLEQATNDKIVQWYFDAKNYVAGKSQIYNVVECNGFQDPWYEQTWLPSLADAEKQLGSMPMIPDDRDKPDKFSRIEGNLEPLNRMGKLVFNEDEKNNPHMIRLEGQFKAVAPNMKAHADGPDATEGGWWFINNKLRVTATITVGIPKRSKYKY